MRSRSVGNSYESASRRDNPGPGAYNLAATSSGHKRAASYGFGGASTARGGRGGRPSSAPGPGQYTHESMSFATKRSSPSMRFGSSHREQASSSAGMKDVGVSPGPGSYNGGYDMTRHQQPNYSVSPRRPMSAGHATPGPGAYQPTHIAKPDTPEAPQWRFGTASRKNGREQQVPGPGNYNANTLMGAGGPKYSMRAKHGPQHGDNDFPGPGHVGGQYTQFE